MADKADHEEERTGCERCASPQRPLHRKGGDHQAQHFGTVAATESASADASAASSEAAGETTAAAPAETTAAATTALETTAAPSKRQCHPRARIYGPGYVNEATTAAAAETNQAPSDMGLISPNGQ